MATSQMSAVIQQLRTAVLLREGAELTDGQLLENYISRREEAALAALVHRHGPMVWGVCRRVLSSYHDAEDAFQATFLVLVRKAASIASPELLANWLYGVAHQTALKTRATTAKRKTRERQVTEMPEPAVTEQDLWHDLQPLLDQELSRLPDIYRVAIVLFDLEGKTRKEAARQLGVPDGTLAARLARGRVMLAKRLARHGLAVSGGSLAAVLAQNVASASAPSSVVLSTIKVASLFAAGQAAAAGVISAQVAALTEGVLKTMLLTKLKIATAVLLAVVALIGVGAGVDGYCSAPTEQPRPAKKPARDEKPGAGSGRREEKPARAEKSALDGGWILVVQEEEGKRKEFPQGVGIELFIRGQEFNVYAESKGIFGGGRKTLTASTFRWRHVRPLDGKPEGIDLVDALDKPWRLGIYKLEGDRLTICWGEKERPTGFTTKPGSGSSVNVFKRQQDPKAPAQEKGWKERATLQGHGDQILCVAYSADVVAVGCKDGTIKLWNAQTGKEQCTTFGRHEGGVAWVAFSPDGRWLYSAGSKDKETFVMDTNQDLSKKNTYLTATFADEGQAHVMAPDATTWVQFGRGNDADLVEIDYTGTLKGNQAQMARELARCKGHQGRVRTACFSLDSQTVATGGDDKTVRVWDRDGKELATLEGHTEAVVLVTVGRDGKVVASVGKDGTAKLWDVASKKELPALKLQKGVRCAVFSADGKFLATGGDDGIVKVWNVTAGEEHATFKGHKGAIRSLTFSPDNNTLASGSQDKTVKLWQVQK